MESQPQNPEFRINPDNFHPCSTLCVKSCDFKYFLIHYFKCVLGAQLSRSFKYQQLMVEK